MLSFYVHCRTWCRDKRHPGKAVTLHVAKLLQLLSNCSNGHAMPTAPFQGCYRPLICLQAASKSSRASALAIFCRNAPALRFSLQCDILQNICPLAPRFNRLTNRSGSAAARTLARQTQLVHNVQQHRHNTHTHTFLMKAPSTEILTNNSTWSQVTVTRCLYSKLAAGYVHAGRILLIEPQSITVFVGQ